MVENRRVKVVAGKRNDGLSWIQNVAGRKGLMLSLMNIWGGERCFPSFSKRRGETTSRKKSCSQSDMYFGWWNHTNLNERGQGRMWATNWLLHTFQLFTQAILSSRSCSFNPEASGPSSTSESTSSSLSLSNPNAGLWLKKGAYNFVGISYLNQKFRDTYESLSTQQPFEVIGVALVQPSWWDHIHPHPPSLNFVSRVRSHPEFPPAFRQLLRLDVLGLASVRFLCDVGSGPEDGGLGSSLQVATCVFNGLFDYWSPRI